MKASAVSVLVGLALLGTNGAQGFQVHASDNGLPSLSSITRDLKASASGGHLPPPLRRRGAERTLLYPSAQALYEQGKDASREARRQVCVVCVCVCVRV